MASVDIDIIANPASMAASLQRMQKAKDDIAKGVTGGVARWDTEFNILARVCQRDQPLRASRSTYGEVLRTGQPVRLAQR